MVVLWTSAAALTVAAIWLRPHALLPAARETTGPFATLAAIIAGSVLLGRLGLFGVLAGWITRGQARRSAAAASVLAFTVVLSGAVNLDVAVVVAMPVALETARRHDLAAGRLAVAVAMTANATSFLLPTSNITSLLLLGRVRLAMLAYLQHSWLAWLLVVAVTVPGLTAWVAKAAAQPRGRDRAALSSNPHALPPASASPSLRALTDLIPMFTAAAAIRTLVVGGITLRAGLDLQVLAGSALSSVLNNLPAAALLRPAGEAALWSAIVATAIGPGLLVTGSVASLICRRIARDSGTELRAWQFSAVGLVLVPAQLAGAVLGLRLAGVPL